MFGPTDTHIHRGRQKLDTQTNRHTKPVPRNKGGVNQRKKTEGKNIVNSTTANPRNLNNIPSIYGVFYGFKLGLSPIIDSAEYS